MDRAYSRSFAWCLVLEKKSVLPGDKVAVLEEFFPGRNTYEFQGTIRSLSLGIVDVDKKAREIRVNPAVKPKTIEVGDYVIGQVESVQQNSANIKIYYLNDRFVANCFSGTLFMKNSMKRPWEGSLVKLGDIVRCRVVSKANNLIHLSIEDGKSGVLFALCSRCGKKLQPVGNRAKCVECGNIEYRKFAEDFVFFENLKP